MLQDRPNHDSPEVLSRDFFPSALIEGSWGGMSSMNCGKPVYCDFVPRPGQYTHKGISVVFVSEVVFSTRCIFITWCLAFRFNNIIILHSYMHYD